LYPALALLPDFALILLGFGLRRTMRLGEHFWSGLEKLIYFVLFPALLFHAIARTRIDFAAAAPFALSGVAAMGGGMLLGLLLRPLFDARPTSAAGPRGMVFASRFQCAFRFNSYIGLAVAGKLHGEAGIAAMGILIGAMVPIANLASVWMLARHGQLGVLREIARNPLILATLAGLLFNLGGAALPEVAGQFLARLSEASIALGLLAVGAALKRAPGVRGAPGLRWPARGQAAGGAGDRLAGGADAGTRWGVFRCGGDVRRAAHRQFGLHPGHAHGRGRAGRRLADLGVDAGGDADDAAVARRPGRGLSDRYAFSGLPAVSEPGAAPGCCIMFQGHSAGLAKGLALASAEPADWLMACMAARVARCISSPWMLICSMFRFMRSQPSTVFSSAMRLSSSPTSRVGVTMPGTAKPMLPHMPLRNSSGSVFGLSADMIVSVASIRRMVRLWPRLAYVCCSFHHQVSSREKPLSVQQGGMCSGCW
jgi:malonate transporter